MSRISTFVLFVSLLFAWTFQSFASADEFNPGIPFAVSDGASGRPGSLDIYQGDDTVTVMVCNEDLTNSIRAANPLGGSTVDIKPLACGTVNSTNIRLSQTVGGTYVLHGRYWLIVP